MRNGFAVLGLSFTAVLIACGNTSHSDPDKAPPDSGSLGGSTDGASGSAGNGAGGSAVSSGGATGGGPASAGCARPLAQWTAVSGDIQSNVGSSAFVGGALVFIPPGGMTGGTISIDEQHPATPGAQVPFSAAVPLSAAARGGERIFALGGPSGAAQLSVIGTDGTVKSAATGVSALALPRVAVTASADRVVAASGDGAGTFVVDTFDASLASLGSQALPHYSFGAARSTAQGFELAVINLAAQSLEVYALTATSKTLERSHALAMPSLWVAWAGDALVVQAGGLVLISPDDSRLNLPLPPEVTGSTNLAWLNGTSSALGTVIGVDIENKSWLGLIRNGAVEWAGPSEQSVYADVRADDHSLGTYFIATARNRTLAYLGWQCPSE